ncbi:retinaldehyde-binding protein 1 isoform X1 [Cydia strobilella]|uniref:retinaldehyde-binding protein 1 isoform X1 n=1 Tax=Cydia strobilella TaxID=1100964 RepID=UPI0030065FFA
MKVEGKKTVNKMPEGIEPVSRVIYREVTPELSQHMLTDVDKLPAVQLGDFLLQIELDEPTDTFREIARKELRETPEVTGPAIAELKRLLEADKDLHVPLESDAWLVRFLRPCKFYPESAYELIKRYYHFKLKHAKHYDGLMPSKEQNIFYQDILTVLPTRDQLGRRILVVELGKRWKPSKCTLDEAFKGCVLFLEAAMMEPVSQICGAQVIMDMEGLSMQQVWQFTPQFAKRLLDWLQESIPVRIKGVFIVNQPYIFNMVYQLFKPFLKEKLRSRLLFVGKDWELLHKYVSPKCLPEAYGGTLSTPKITGPQWLELLLMCDKEFSAIASYGYVNK